MKRGSRLLFLVVVCLAAVAQAACTRETIQSGEARLSFSRARVQVASATGPFRLSSGGVSLQRGDRVKVITGEAELRLAEGARLLLHAGSLVGVGADPELLGGDVVALPGRRVLAVRSAGSRVEVFDGATRVRSGLAVVAGVYRGRARLVSAGRTQNVPALRQGTIVTFGALSSRPRPLTYRATDRWDAQYLGVAIDIGEELRGRSDGFSAQLRPSEGHTLGFFETLLPSLPARAFEACQSDLGRPPGETLVGATIALTGTAGPFEDRCRRTFSFRSDGADWGLVALDQGVRELPGLRRELTAAIGRLAVPSAVAAPVTPADVSTPPPAADTPPSTPGPSPEPVPVGTEPASPDAPVVPGPAAPVVPGGPETPTPTPVGDLLQPVSNLVGGLLDGLLP